MGERLTRLIAEQQARLDREREERAAAERLGEARRLLRWCESNGRTVTLTEPDGIGVTPAPPAEKIPEFKAAKSALLSLLRGARP